MGKEAKIGMAVIGVLAVVFAVVLATRLIGSKDDTDVALQPDGPPGPAAPPDARDTPPPPPKATELEETKSGPRSLAGSGGSSHWALASDSSGSVPAPVPPPPGAGSGASGTHSAYTSPPPKISSPDRDPFLGQTRQVPPDDADLAGPAPGLAPLAPGEPYGSATPGQGQHPGGGAGAPRAFRNESGYSTSSQETPNSSYGTSGATSGSAYGASGSGYGATGSSHAMDPPPRGPRPGLDSSGYQTIPPAPRAGRAYDAGAGGSADPYRPGASSLTSSGGSSSLATGEGRRADGTYVVQPKDSFWTISERLYGTGAYFKALAERNREALVDRDQLRVGQTIQAPDQSELEQKYPELCPSPERRDTIRQRSTLASTSNPYARGRPYTVQEGDSLYDIARFELGKGSRWTEIYELNQDVLRDDFDYLTPGMKLLLPEDSRDTVTRRPRSTNPY